MKDLLVLILVSLLSPFVLAQKTYYTTGLGDNAWNDPNSWTLTEGTINSAGIPGPHDHVVINHYLTHFAAPDYIHYGTVKIASEGTYEIIVNQSEGGGYKFAGKLFDVHGTLISAGNFHHQLAGSQTPAFLIFRPSAMVYLIKDLVLDGTGHTVINNASCGAAQSFKDIQFRNEGVQLYGKGNFILGGKIRSWNDSGSEQLTLASATEQAKRQIGRDFSLYATDVECENVSPSITGIAQLQPVSGVLRVSAIRKGLKVDLSWQADQSSFTSFFVVERSYDGLLYEVIDQVEGSIDVENGLYSTRDESPLNEVTYYRVRQIDLMGREQVSDAFILRNEAFMNLYPNPSTGQQFSLNLTGFETDANVKVTVRNIMGQMIAEESLQADAGGSLLHTFQYNLLDGSYLIQASSTTVQLTKTLQVR